MVSKLNNTAKNCIFFFFFIFYNFLFLPKFTKGWVQKLVKGYKLKKIWFWEWLLSPCSIKISSQWIKYFRCLRNSNDKENNVDKGSLKAVDFTTELN